MKTVRIYYINLLKAHLIDGHEKTKSFGKMFALMDKEEENKNSELDKDKKKILNNKQDSSQNVNEPTSTKCYIINPDQNIFKKMFDALFYLLLYIDFIFTAFEYFVYRGDYTIYRIICFDIFFTIEIILHFFTSYYDTNSKSYVTDLKKIFINYIKGQFIISVLYVFPFYAIYSHLEILRLIKLYQYPKVMTKIKRLSSWILSHFIKNIIICSQIVRIFTFVISICYIAHIMACIYCYLGLTFADSWIYAHLDLILPDSYLDIYIGSYYFIIETLTSTGYGDLTPSCYTEIIFIMFVQLITCGLYAYLLSNILDVLLSKENSSSYKYRSNQLNLENWIIYYLKKLPASSKNDNLHRNKIWGQIKKYFELYYSPTKNLKWITDNNFIAQMKPSHRNQILMAAFEPILFKFFSFFAKIKSTSSKIKIILNFKTKIQEANTELNFPWKKIQKIYFIEYGSVDLFKNGVLWHTLNEGSFFGIESILLNENADLDISYKVSEQCRYAIFFTIDIPFLVDEILNYDGESFMDILHSAKYFIKKVLNKSNVQNDLDSLSSGNGAIIEENENEINTNHNLINEKNDNDLINKVNELKKGKINLDLINPGCLPDLDNTIEVYKKAEKIIDESNLKLDLMEKQMNFINKYVEQVKRIKKNINI